MSTFPDLPKLILPKGLQGSLWFYWYVWEEWVPLVLEVLNKWYPQRVVRDYWRSVAEAANAAQDRYAWQGPVLLKLENLCRIKVYLQHLIHQVQLCRFSHHLRRAIMLYLLTY